MVNNFEEMIKDLHEAKRKAERLHKRQKYSLGTYEDGYICALNYALTRIDLYVEQVRHEIEEERKHDIKRD